MRRRGSYQAVVGALVASGAVLMMACSSNSTSSNSTPTNRETQAKEWAAATQKAAAIVADMTTAEMQALVLGTGGWGTPNNKHYSAGYVGAVTVAKTGFVIPAQYLCDGPNGVGNNNVGVTRFPTAISVAASFDVELAKAYGDALGNEWFEKGCTHGLGPGMNIIRLPYGGRSAEYYSEDPFLSAQLAVGEVQGIQGQHVIATVKHFAVNNQETERSGGNSSLSERTLREIYLPAFESSVKEGGAGSLMCSYNRINGTYACGNAHLQNEIARGDWGFSGLIMSDWGANHGNDPTGAVAYARAGLDMDMPGGNYTPTNLAGLDDATLRAMSIRIVAAMYKVGILSDGVKAADVTDATKVVSTDAHKQLAQDISASGTVLLKNVGATLPIDKKNAALKIAVIGGAADADAQNTLGGSGNVSASEQIVTPLAGIRAAAAGTVTYYKGSPGGSGSLGAVSAHSTSGAASDDGFAVTYADAASGQPLYNDAAKGAFPPVQTVGTLPNQKCTVFAGFRFCSGGSVFLGNGTQVSVTDGSMIWKADYLGYVTVASAGTYEFNLAGNGGAELYVDGARVTSIESAFLVDNRSAFVKLTAGEHQLEVRYDTSVLSWIASPSLSIAWNKAGNDLDAAVAGAAAADVAIVVVSDAETEGADHGALLPGSQNELVARVAAVAKKTVVVLNTGSGLVLPWADQVQAIVENWYGGQRMGTALASVLFGDVNPSGRTVVTFPTSTAQWYAQDESQFPGVKLAGQSYHTVSYDEGVFPGYRWFDQNQLAPLFPFGHGLSYTTFLYGALSLSSSKGDGSSLTATVKITNTGSRSGAEVAQLYLGFPDYAGEAPRQLKGFQKVTVEPGKSATVTFALDARAFQYWDEARGGWVTPPGEFKLYVGASSRDIRATAAYTIEQ